MSNFGLPGLGLPYSYKSQVSAAALATASYHDGRIAPPGFLGVYGLGMWNVFTEPGSYTFIVPPTISKIRVRVVGAGGGGGWFARSGGGGGGFAIGEYDVSEGQSFTATVGAGSASNGGAGGTSSFGSLISATGGGAGYNLVDTIGTGGIGVGGYYRASGGNGGGAVGGSSGGGGAAGSQLGNGGNGGNYGGGGGGVGRAHARSGVSAAATGGASPFGYAPSGSGAPDCLGNVSTGAGKLNDLLAVIRFPFDGFTGGGGYGLGSVGGHGAGGGGGGSTSGGTAGNGGIGAGGGGGGGTGGAGNGGWGYGGNGGIGGGGGSGGNNSTGGTGTIGGNGLVVVEW